MVSTFSGKGLLTGFCEESNEFSGSMYALNFLRKNYHLFQQYRAALI
jgi:ABC-type uncharacterized transport system fused permease/ATPase subunit